jgi:predicted nucleotidyltransferase
MNPTVEIIKININLFSDLHTILLFGSAATGHLQVESDIDIAVASYNHLSLSKRLEIIERFSKLFDNREIDLIDLNHTEGLIHKEIFTKGLVIKEDLDFYLRKLSDMYDYMELYYPFIKEDRLNRVKEFFFR